MDMVIIKMNRRRYLSESVKNFGTTVSSSLTDLDRAFEENTRYQSSTEKANEMRAKIQEWHGRALDVHGQYMRLVNELDKI
jgi:uncharacterized phage infection (PIP) family protein YhgE